MAGDYYNSQTENPAKRAQNTPGLFSQIFDALSSFINDVTNPKKYQDRGSASPVTTDILALNSQTTPPAAVNFAVPENPELKGAAEHNEKQIRFLGINEGYGKPSAQGGNKAPVIPLMGISLDDKHTPLTKQRFSSLNELLGKTPRGSQRTRFATLVSQVSGKKVIDQSQVTAEPSGASSGGSGGSSGGSSGGGGGTGGGGGSHGGGVTTRSKASEL